MRAPASAAALELGLLAKMLGRSDATAILRAVAANASEPIVAGRALHALGAFDDANDVFRNAVVKAPKDPEANTAWGQLYLDAHQKADALELFSAALEGDEKWTPAHPRRRAGAGRRRSAASRRGRQEGARDQSVVRRGARLPRQPVDGPGSERGGAPVAAEGAGHQPVEPRGALRAGRHRLRRRQDRRVRGRGREGAGHLAGASARCIASPAS